ncbi:formate dehydrogenase accessory sulfurtransferase FdhD [Luteimicrobium subarcticum]|uniref:Sulfur carrier protein FdhD n=1 Tax=Luteimicrobium subarcticum TaxID=620910 RepID=A0A2M8WT03_9MICO|nr:formate dehydrogenase accessory sulfurtransferase FdhD [Luteimicrobium subarcticum]PJI94077.1 FdhD protein [Luteimicrobium subarcticum]
MSRVTVRRRVVRVRTDPPDGVSVSRREDVLAAEEPLEIRVGGRRLAVTMRTPGHDIELATGYLVAEGVVGGAADVATAQVCAGTPGEPNMYNVVDVRLAAGVPGPSASLERNVLTTSACGLCGRTSIDAVRTRSAFEVRDDDVRVAPDLLVTFPDRLRATQAVFEKTGGLHAAGLFDAATGELLVVREDVGRHNAVDKVVGWALTSGRLPLRGTVLMVSGRASFELTQKAYTAGIPVLAAVSAPSSLAVELAEDVGVTLVGFLRGGSMVVYAGEQRVLDDAGDPSHDGADARVHVHDNPPDPSSAAPPERTPRTGAAA